jgi:hypothetical protein
LEPEDRSIPVNVNLVKRIDEDWQVGHLPLLVGHPLRQSIVFWLYVTWEIS